MDSKIAKLIKLSNHVVAAVQADACPEKALQLKSKNWACVTAMLAAAAKGKVVAFTRDTTPCLGGRTGLCFEKYPLGWIEYFLSCGGEGVDRCEFYKKNPDIAREFICNVSNALVEKLPPRKKYLLFKPLDLIDDETPDVIVFLVNADQLSGLFTLANYDKAGAEGAKILFGAGCAQTILYPLSEKDFCFVGLTDPSARPFFDKNLLAFSMSYERFLQLEGFAEESFLHTEAWAKIYKRI